MFIGMDTNNNKYKVNFYYKNYWGEDCTECKIFLIKPEVTLSHDTNKLTKADVIYQISYGNSRKNPQDHPDRKIGREVAFSRALDNLRNDELSKCLVDGYLKMVNNKIHSIALAKYITKGE